MASSVSFFADPQALASIKQDAKAQDPAALKAAARQFESLFTQMLLKSMREANKSMGGDSLFGGDQADFYQDMFDDQMAVHLSQGKGLGLADMLIRQLTQAQPAGPEAGGLGLGLERSRGVSSSDLQPPAPSPQPIASSQEDFVRQMLPYAQKAARALGVDPHALVAQAALETGWGKSVPCKANGECSFNLFGIKTGSQWSGATVNVSTLEFEAGIPVRKVDRFRAYDSAADSFMDYARLIGNSPRYENALGAGSDIESFASALQEGGYATDPQYAKKLVAVARDVKATIGAGEFKNSADAPIADAGV